MASFLQTLILLVCAIALLLCAPARGQGDRTSFTYDFYGSKPTNLLYQGDAHFPSDTTYLRLTKTGSSGNALQYSVGRVVYPTPVKFWEAGAQADIETTIKFIIKPNNGDGNPADGFTFFIEPVGSTVGSNGGSLGIFESNGKRPSVFAAEFDIYSNAGVDPTYRHIGIDIESNVSKNTTNVGDALLGQEVTARINYNEATKVIDVHLTAGAKKYEVSYVYDLSSILNEQVNVGISAATGDRAATHDLISWYFTSTLVQSSANEGDNINIRQYV